MSRMKSFSPSINNKLDVKSMASFSKMQKQSIKLCDDLLKINVAGECLDYQDPNLQKILLNRLKYSKNLEPTTFRAPKQLYGNCWFNTMFVTFFFSDKGKKFFRFFREMMIKGTKIDGTPIEDEELRKMFFVLNLFIEASFNQNYARTDKTGTGTKGIKGIKKIIKRTIKGIKKTIGTKRTKVIKIIGIKDTSPVQLFDTLNLLTNKLGTNYFIKIIHDRINHLVYNVIPDVNEAGNPISFYKTLMSSINYNLLKFKQINIDEKSNIQKILNDKFAHSDNNIKQVIPDIFLMEDHESKSIYETKYVVSDGSKQYTYVLDSIIITNKSFFKPRADSHFVSLLTVNKELYKFDGSSYSRLSKFNWKPLINTNEDWTFKENPDNYATKYNFTFGYKMMFYYRV